ncbi:DUF447 domain-containing protein [Halalkalicoccus jeotgali]|uniref:DUF447 family protein n=1 Tax=Halalkalicoccus jeotgali (strain DSM 18796 / CECT 7217 / JCM 14584 / KCTC 4019 / B3) TaxID=795797 RepID=D8JAS1_HALJB|nr:DUF447 domain-containing protein [Halalkalicoccus jeotgali]ADJ14793.1 hypothetical protein HacjB3_07030 [Halalkalicoccus jeotgali B3]ELY39375.1 hypothetical protein C497_05437 [Halalkalicoccus jeotgali B3]
MSSAGEGKEGWPVELTGVTESVVSTLGPNDRWNFAALGLFAGEPVTARTWGNTRTRRNFHGRGEGYVQFTRDPVAFVEAACSIHEREEPVLPAADAWVRVEAEHVGSGESGGTQWEEWALRPVESVVENRVVPTTSRGYSAVIEGTVAASRLDVESYDTGALLDRLAYFEGVVERCGGEREREAFSRLSEHTGWTHRNESF